MLINKNEMVNIADTTTKNLRNCAMSMPKSLCAEGIPQTIDADINYRNEQLNLSGNILVDLLNKQHPLIHTWFLLSTISICLLSALFFIFQ